jgi:cytoskeleton protein RodZ
MIGAYLAWYNWTGAGSRSVDTVPPLPPRIETAARDANPAWNDPPPTPPGPAVNPPPGTAAGPPPPPGGAAPPAPRPAAPPPAAAPRPDEPRILLRARADTWIQVRDRGAGTVVMNKLLHPGETWQVPPREGLFLTIGNVSGLEILVDGQVINPPAAASRVSRDIPLDAERLKSGAAYVPAATAPAPGAPPTGGARPTVPPANPAVPMPQ